MALGMALTSAWLTMAANTLNILRVSSRGRSRELSMSCLIAPYAFSMYAVTTCPHALCSCIELPDWTLQAARVVPVLLSMLVLVYDEKWVPEGNHIPIGDMYPTAQFSDEDCVPAGLPVAWHGYTFGSSLLTQLPTSLLSLYQLAFSAGVERFLMQRGSRATQISPGTLMTLLKRIAAAAHTRPQQQRSFDRSFVESVLSDDLKSVWWELLADHGALPFIKTLELSYTDIGASRFEFKHFEFQEALFAIGVIDGSTPTAWNPAEHLYDSFYANVFRIGGSALGRCLAVKLPPHVALNAQAWESFLHTFPSEREWRGKLTQQYMRENLTFFDKEQCGLRTLALTVSADWQAADGRSLFDKEFVDKFEAALNGGMLPGLDLLCLFACDSNFDLASKEEANLAAA